MGQSGLPELTSEAVALTRLGKNKRVRYNNLVISQLYFRQDF